MALLLGLWKHAVTRSDAYSAPDRRFEFDKRSQLFIRVHNEALTVALCGNNPNCSPFAIHSCNAAPTETGLAEIVSDDLPVLHCLRPGIDLKWISPSTAFNSGTSSQCAGNANA